MKILHNIKVIDLSTVLAGPSVTSFLGELGAQVIKFETPQNGGDVTRLWRLAQESNNTPICAYFASINYCKSYATLDLQQPESKERLLQELATTDILVSNFKAGDAAKFGLEPEKLAKEFPKLIQAHITGFASRPDRVAYDVVLQAECGMMEINGDADGLPTKFPLALVDVLAAHQLKEAILLALYQRSLTGQGAVVSVTLEKSGLSALINQASNYMMCGEVPKRMGSLHPNIAPYGEQFVCSDGQSIVLAIGSNQQFEAFLRLIGLKHLIGDERFAVNSKRVINRSELSKYLSVAIAKSASTALLSDCLDAKIPIGLIKSMPAVIAMAESLDMVHEEMQEGITTKRIKSVAFTFDN